ncbi:hypothetical protein, partial [Ruegeria haliotis]|uniref:hypothetical protein n=1 Tax=Ruegeria haliotis TaxID=2747601 RepID=UPI001B7D8EC8
CPQSLLSVPTVSPARLQRLTSAGEGGSKYNPLQPQAENWKLPIFFDFSYFITLNQPITSSPEFQIHAES